MRRACRYDRRRFFLGIAVSETELERLQSRIESFLASAGAHEVTEEGERLFHLAETEWRLEIAQEKLLLRLSSARRTWVRRVLEIAEEKPERLVLRVERFGRRPGKLVVAPSRRLAGEAARRDARRREYVAVFRRLLARQFPRARLEGLSTAADLKRSFSPLYARARLLEAGGAWAALGVNPDEDAAAVDAALTYALIWLDWNRRRYPDRRWAGLRLFLPAGRTGTTANRLAALAGAGLRFELFAVEEENAACERLDERDFGNLQTVLAPCRSADEVLVAERPAVERIRALAPEAIEAVVAPGGHEVALRFRGLEFARSARGEVRFGIGRAVEALTERKFSSLKTLVSRLARERAASGSPRGAYYRLQPERWLESVVRARPHALDPRLEPARLYAQVPAVVAGERGVVDLLGATREGRLVVIELKASTDVQLPVQALDYWLRVRWHHQRGEFSRLGYFPGSALHPEPPEILLVAPALQFHPTTEALIRYFAPGVRVTTVGLAADWRGVLKVVFRRGRESLAVEI